MDYFNNEINEVTKEQFFRALETEFKPVVRDKIWSHFNIAFENCPEMWIEENQKERPIYEERRVKYV